MKSFVVHPFGVRIGLTSKPEEFISWWNKYSAAKDKLDMAYMDRCRGMAGTLDDRPAPPLFVIYMPVDYEITTAFHESLHMAHFVMDFCEAPITLESTETQAYLMEHIVEKIKEKIR